MKSDGSLLSLAVLQRLSVGFIRAVIIIRIKYDNASECGNLMRKIYCKPQNSHKQFVGTPLLKTTILILYLLINGMFKDYKIL